MNSKGSVRAAATADWKVQGYWQGNETGGSVWQGATPAVAKMAVTESRELRELRQQWQSAAVEAGRCRASLGGEGM